MSYIKKQNIMHKLNEHFRNPELFPINQNRGEGFEFKLHDDTFITTGNKDDKNPEFREARLDITTYGVEHYYGKLKVYINNVDKNKPNRSVSGYLGGVVLPEESKDINLDVVRLVTQADIDADRVRWEDYHVNDKTNAFYTEEEIVEIVESLKDELFKGKWVILVQGVYIDDKKIIVDN